MNFDLFSERVIDATKQGLRLLVLFRGLPGRGKLHAAAISQLPPAV